MFFPVLCLLCFCARLFICACWERVDLLALACGVRGNEHARLINYGWLSKS